MAISKSKQILLAEARKLRNKAKTKRYEADKFDEQALELEVKAKELE